MANKFTDYDMRKFAIKDQKRITCDLIQQVVADFYSVSVGDLKAKRRNREISIPRQIAMFLTREMTDMSLTQIGMSFNRDHTTVIHAYEKIGQQRNEDSKLDHTIKELIQRIERL